MPAEARPAASDIASIAAMEILSADDEARFRAALTRLRDSLAEQTKLEEAGPGLPALPAIGSRVAISGELCGEFTVLATMGLALCLAADFVVAEIGDMNGLQAGRNRARIRQHRLRRGAGQVDARGETRVFRALRSWR